MQRKRIQYVSTAGVFHRAPVHQVNAPNGRISKIKLAGAWTSSAAASRFLPSSARWHSRWATLILNEVKGKDCSTTMAPPKPPTAVIDLAGDDSDDAHPHRKSNGESLTIDLTMSSSSEKGSPVPSSRHVRAGAPALPKRQPKSASSDKLQNRPNMANSSATRNTVREPSSSNQSGSQATHRPKPAPSVSAHGSTLRSPPAQGSSTEQIGRKRQRERDLPPYGSGPAKRAKLQSNSSNASSPLPRSESRGSKSTNEALGTEGLRFTHEDNLLPPRTTATPKRSSEREPSAKPRPSSRPPSSSRAASGTPKPAPIANSSTPTRPGNSKGFFESFARKGASPSSRTRLTKIDEVPSNLARTPNRQPSPKQRNYPGSADRGLEVPESPLQSPQANVSDTEIGPRKASAARPRDTSTERGSGSHSKRVSSKSPQRPAKSPQAQGSASRSGNGSSPDAAARKRKYPLSPSETSLEDVAQTRSDEPGKNETSNPQTNSKQPQVGRTSTPDRHKDSSSNLKAQPSSKEVPQATKEAKSPGTRASSVATMSKPIARSEVKEKGAPAPITEKASASRPGAHREGNEAQAPSQPTTVARTTALESGVTSSTAFKSPRAKRSIKPPNVTTSRHVEHAVGKYIDELRNDNDHFARSWLKEARNAATQQASDEPTPIFQKMRPLELEQLSATQMNKKKAAPGQIKISVERYPSTRSQIRTHWAVPSKSYDLVGEDVPNYAHYVSIKDNFLANNEGVLQHWPYFGDEFDMNDAQALQEHYWFDVESRHQKLERMAQAERYAEYCEEMLEDIGCEWSDVLRFLLEPLPDLGSDRDAHTSLQRRKDFCKEEFVRIAEPWVNVLSQLRKPDAERVGKAALLCDHFQRMTNVSLWHVARRSEYVKKLFDQHKDYISADELTCRTCMRFNCPYHGEIKESSDGESLPQPSKDKEELTVATDIINPQEVNHRRRVGFPPSVDGTPLVTGTKDRKALRYWQVGPNANLLHNKADARGPFYPCHHPGTPCETAKCSCYEARIPCEKTCGCGPGCTRKFQGCNCSRAKTKKTKRVCFENEDCACYQLGRECDADLCGDCGVCEVLDPVHRHDDTILHGRCRNASIQRGVPKHTILGDSGVHGLGLYACEDIREHDYVAEYKGEIVTKDEAERRGAVYEHQKLSYLFSLNQDQEIDSTYLGNKVRFINHANSKKANLYARTYMCNTVHRIALFGAKRIQPGEELFFDYGPLFPEQQLGGTAKAKTAAAQSQSKSVPHVRNSMLVSEFHDIIEVKDGPIKRARKSGKLSKSSLTRGGASKKATKSTRRGKAVEVEEEEGEDDAPESDGDASDRDNGYEPADIGKNMSDYRPEDEAMEVDEGDENSSEPEEALGKRGRGRPRKHSF